MHVNELSASAALGVTCHTRMKCLWVRQPRWCSTLPRCNLLLERMSAGVHFFRCLMCSCFVVSGRVAFPDGRLEQWPMATLGSDHSASPQQHPHTVFEPVNRSVFSENSAAVAAQLEGAGSRMCSTSQFASNGKPGNALAALWARICGNIGPRVGAGEAGVQSATAAAAARPSCASCSVCHPSRT